MQRDGCRLAVLVVAVAVLAGGPGPVSADDGARADDPEARALVKRVLDAAPDVPFTAKLTLVIEGGVTRQLALSHKRMGDARASYLEVTAPLNVKDTRFLFLERIEATDEQLVYVPAIKRVSQIGEDARKQPFLGSEFYVSDLVTPALDDFTYRFTGDADLGGRACKLVEAVPKHPERELYAKTVFALDPADLLVMRVEFFDLKGRPLKVWTVERLERIDGFWTAREQRMTNVQEHATSRLSIDAIAYRVEIPDAVFGRAHLAR